MTSESNYANTIIEAPNSEQLHGYPLACLLLIGFALTMCLGGLGSGPPLGDHEAIVAQAARQTLQSGQWLIPHLGEIPRIRKTPLDIWATAAVSWLIDNPSSAPVSEFSARLPSALAAFFNVLLIWWVARMMYGPRTGLVGGFLSAGCVMTILFSHNAQVDMLLTTLTTLSFACFYRGIVHPHPRKAFMMAFYPAFALAMMAKGPLPLATVGLSLAVYWFVTVPVLNVSARDGVSNIRSPGRPYLRVVWQQFKGLRRLWLLPGLVVFLVLAGAWPLYVCLKIENAPKLWMIEYLDRYTGEMSDRSRPFYYYIQIIFGFTAPFLLSIPEAVAAPFLKRYRPWREGLAYAFTWAIVGTLFLSSSSFKRPHYLLSVMPGYCLLLTPVVDRLFFGVVSVASRAAQYTCRILPIALAIAFVIGGCVLKAEYPGLLRAYVLLACGVFAAWAAAGWFYARGQRTASFALLNMGTMVIALLAWPIAGKHLGTNTEGQALVRDLHKHGVPLDAAIYWVGEREDASIEFYSGFRIRLLINEIEMAALRGDRGPLLPDEVYQEFVRRIRQRLAGPEPIYLILSAGHHDMLQRNTDIRSRILFELNGFHDEPGDELIVITQPEKSR